MSTQRGNVVRTRSQKYRNTKQFKNDLHDTSSSTKLINKLEVVNVCSRCKSIIEWKIKYKKYKPLKSPANCVKCHKKTVKQAYHIMCTACATESECCPKCGKQNELIVSSSSSKMEELLKLPRIEDAIRGLSERRRRTFYRQIKNDPSKFNTEEEILDKLKGLSLKPKDPSELNDSSEDFEDDFFL